MNIVKHIKDVPIRCWRWFCMALLENSGWKPHQQGRFRAGIGPTGGYTKVRWQFFTAIATCIMFLYHFTKTPIYNLSVSTCLNRCEKIEESPSGHGLSGGPIAAELLLTLNGRAEYFDHKWLTCQHAVSTLDRGGVAYVNQALWLPIQVQSRPEIPVVSQ